MNNPVSTIVPASTMNWFERTINMSDRLRAEGKAERFRIAIRSFQWMNRYRRWIGIVELTVYIKTLHDFPTDNAARRYARRLVYALTAAHLIELKNVGRGNNGINGGCRLRVVR